MRSSQKPQRNSPKYELEIGTLKGKINQSFSRALSEYNALDYLDDIRETVVENRRCAGG